MGLKAISQVPKNFQQWQHHWAKSYSRGDPSQ